MPMVCISDHQTSHLSDILFISSRPHTSRRLRSAIHRTSRRRTRTCVTPPLSTISSVSSLSSLALRERWMQIGSEHHNSCLVPFVNLQHSHSRPHRHTRTIGIPSVFASRRSTTTSPSLIAMASSSWSPSSSRSRSRRSSSVPCRSRFSVPSCLTSCPVLPRLVHVFFYPP